VHPPAIDQVPVISNRSGAGVRAGRGAQRAQGRADPGVQAFAQLGAKGGKRFVGWHSNGVCPWRLTFIGQHAPLPEMALGAG